MERKMKQEWSRNWIGSVQPRKQRKYRHNAPLHVRQKFVAASLSKTLRERFGKRSMSLRKGDEVEVMRGSFRGRRGVVERVDLSKTKIYIDEIKVKKSDGSEVMRALQPSNLRIVKLNLDDKKRQAILDRVSGKEEKPVKAPAKDAKPVKAEKKDEPAARPAPKKAPAKKPAPKKAPAKKESKPAKPVPRKPAPKKAPARKAAKPKAAKGKGKK